MNKNRIRLTESDLHRIIRESVNNVLKENAVYNSDNSDELYEEIMSHLQTAYDLCKEYRQNVRGSQQELNWAMKTLNTIGHMLSGHV